MTTDTGAQAGVSNDVEARAREVIATSLIGRRVPVNKHGRVDDIGIGGQVGRQFSSLALTALTAANLRIVSAEADDRRTAALEAFTEWWHMEQKRLDVIGEVPGASFSHDDLVQWKSSKAAIIGFLTDDSGKTYTTESEG